MIDEAIACVVGDGLCASSHLAPVALPARDSSPWLIAKVLSRGLKAYRARISVHFNGLFL
jgi:hypothetical protein